MKIGNYRIFITTLIIVALLLLVKSILHTLGLEVIALDGLHGSAISGVIFVIGFILSATIADYKESERIPAEVASAIENMHEDVISLHENYPKFDLKNYQQQLKNVAESFAGDLRDSKSYKAKLQLHELSRLSAKLEQAGVPANFITKLKQQQALLVRHLFRVNYIQRISFVPSATILAWSIVSLALGLLMITQFESFAGGILLTGVIAFIMVYVLLMIQVIKTPFHDAGKTKDDVSLFLLDRTIKHLRERK